LPEAHRDLADFDFAAAKADRHLVTQLAEPAFTDAAHNVVFIGGRGIGKTHLATAVGVAGITQHAKPAGRCCSTCRPTYASGPA
jgi:DNA replication protein DnaC